MSKWLGMLVMSICLSFGLAGTGVYAAPTTSSTNPSASSANGSKSSNASIVYLYQRLVALEEKDNQQAQKIAELQQQLSALRQELNEVRAEEAFNRSTLKTLHQRVTVLDAKKSSIVFPSN